MGELSRGVVCGARRVGLEALETHARRMASGLAALGVGQGDCVAILMRNDIAFMEALRRSPPATCRGRTTPRR
jgi:long-chain acyl-CoA synthetase